MIYEIALLPVHEEHIERFKHAFAEVAPLLIRAKGYGGHMLAQGIETPELFNLVVRWQSLEDHTPGFEASEDHRVFMTGLRNIFRKSPGSTISRAHRLSVQLMMTRAVPLAG